MTWLHLVVAAQGRRGRKTEGWLRHVVARVCLDQLGKFVAFLLAGVRADQHAVAAGLVGGLDHQLVEVVEHVFAVVLEHAQVAGYIRQQRLLAEVVLDDLGHEGVDHLVIGHAGARRIGQCHVALAPGAHQAVHAEHGLGVEHLGVDEHVVDPAVDHVDPGQPVDAAHVDAVVVANH